MIKIGDTINLEPKDSVNLEKYKSRLVDKSKEHLFIDYPKNLETGKTVYLVDGTQLKASFVGEDMTVYSFETEVQGRIKQLVPVVKLMSPDEDDIVKIQRRQFVRINTLVDVAIHSLNGEFTPFVTVTCDISAGGVSVILPINNIIVPNTTFYCWLVLPMKSGDYEYLMLKSKANRVVHGNHAERNQLPIEFIDISETERQLLIRFCFERQIEKINITRKGFL